MKLISIGTDRKLFEENSAVRQRVIEYGKFFEEIHIIVFSTRNLKYPSSKYQVSKNVWVYPTNSRSRIFYIFDAFRIGKAISSKLKASSCVISCQDPFETGFVGALVKLFYGLPLHIQIHTDLKHKYFASFSLLNKVRILIGDFVIGYSDRIRAVSDRIRKSIAKSPDKIDVLPILAGIKERRNEKMSEIKKPFPFTLLMTCRLEREKNIETVFKSLKQIEDKNIGLCIIGDGSQKDFLKKLSSDTGISDRVVFAGWQNDLASYYKMADAFVSPSFYEGYGVSTLEAAYFGKPLILSETGVAEEVFSIKTDSKKGSCFVCDAKDSECFAENILKLSKDKILAKEMGELAKNEADKHLDSGKDYFSKYANSIKNTANEFKPKNFFTRVFDLIKIAFNSMIYLRYLICGTTAAAVNILSLYIFVEFFGIEYITSSILAFLVALVLSFVLQKFVVFKDMETDGMHRQFSKFFIVALLGVMSNTLLFYIFTNLVGIWYILSQILAGLFVMVQNFVLYKFFIFKN